MQGLGKFSAPDVFEKQFIGSILVVKALAENEENLRMLPSSEGEVDFLFPNGVT